MNFDEFQFENFKFKKLDLSIWVIVSLMEFNVKKIGYVLQFVMNGRVTD